MATDQIVVESQPVAESGALRRVKPPGRRGPGWGRLVTIGLLLVGLGAVGFFLVAARDREKPSEHSKAAGHAKGESASDLLPKVEVVKPKRGGMEHTTNQPGTVRAFDFAELFAKVSGYVKDNLKVDRGSRVKMGDPLVELYVPELAAAVEQAKAQVVRAGAAVEQAKARVTTAEEKIKAQLAFEKEAEAKWQAAVAWRQYRDKQYHRISELVQRQAVEERLKDEAKDEFEKAMADEYAAVAGKETAKAQVAEARAELAQAKADLAGAMADVKVSQATLDKEQALENYTHIKSPYDGVVIFRGEGVHKGAFIRSADQGGDQPMLTVARDDLMRTVILVPDRDVPYCDIGDPAIVTVDALNDREFKGVVSRIAESEDLNDRTMRVEVDLPNPSHVLRDGMYGRAEIILEKATTHLTIPSTAIMDRDSEGKGTVEVVRDGKMYRQQVVIGRDTGTLAEIISGLEPGSDVIIQPDVSMADGTPVQVESGSVAEAHKPSAPAHS